MRSPFQSTRPLRGGTSVFEGHAQSGAFHSTRPLRGGTRVGVALVLAVGISIHPPLAGWDRAGVGRAPLRLISIHPPLAGRDFRVSQLIIGEGNFNPPAPCGAGLCSASLTCGLERFQSARPLRGGTESTGETLTTDTFQSTRPLRGGTTGTLYAQFAREFQSTRPLRGGTAECIDSSCGCGISIHPPLAGRDEIQGMQLPGTEDFNPPAPCGAGPQNVSNDIELGDFNPPAPCGAGQRSCTKKTVQNIAYCTKSAFTLAVLSGFLALMRPFFLPNVHKFRCEPSEESLLAPRSHAYTIRTPSG